MKKETFYFSHDYNSRSDFKIKKLIAKHGYLGYGIFWAIIEDLYNNTNVLRLDYDTIAFDLHCQNETIFSIINEFDLFVINKESFSSSSVESRLNSRIEKSEKARQSVLSRWGKKKDDTNVLRTQYDTNTIKESKVKESKVNNIEERKLKFSSTLNPFIEKFGKELINNFSRYWTEPNKSNSKFRQELEKTWDLERRLETWALREKTFKKKEEVITNLRKQY